MVRRYQDMDRVVICTGYRPFDTAAMYQADCSIALGSVCGSAVEEAAGIVLKTQDLTPIKELYNWSRWMSYCSMKQVQFQCTVVCGVLGISTVGAITFGKHFPLRPFHLIMLNLFCDTIAPMALSFQPFSIALDNYLKTFTPHFVRHTLITDDMRRDILGQAGLQTIVVWFLWVVCGFIPTYGNPRDNAIQPSANDFRLCTLLYNTLFFLNFFNFFNCRELVPSGTKGG